MEFKSVGKTNFVKGRPWKEWKEGEYAVGTFESLDNLDKFGKPIYELKVIESNFTAPGSTLYFNTGGNVQNLMNEVSLEDTIKVLYKGMTKITKGKWSGTMTHNIDIQVAASDKTSEETSTDDLI